MVWTEIAVTLFAALGRNLTGWLQVSLKDGIQDYEWAKLASSTVSIAVLTLAGVYGVGLDTTAAAFSAVAGDIVLSALAKKKK